MRKFLVFFVVAMLALASCGGGGDVDVASNKGKAGDKGAKDAGADAAAKSGAESAPEFTGKGGKNFCEYLTDLQKNEDDLNLSGASTAEQQEKAKKGLDVLQELENKAPDEIKADVVVVIKQVKPFFVALAGGKEYTPGPEDQPTEVESQKFKEAGKRVEAYATNVCGIKKDKPPTDEQAPADETPPADG